MKIKKFSIYQAEAEHRAGTLEISHACVSVFVNAYEKTTWLKSMQNVYNHYASN